MAASFAACAAGAITLLATSFLPKPNNPVLRPAIPATPDA